MVNMGSKMFKVLEYSRYLELCRNNNSVGVFKEFDGANINLSCALDLIRNNSSNINDILSGKVNVNLT